MGHWFKHIFLKDCTSFGKYSVIVPSKRDHDSVRSQRLNFVQTIRQNFRIKWKTYWPKWHKTFCLHLEGHRSNTYAKDHERDLLSLCLRLTSTSAPVSPSFVSSLAGSSLYMYTYLYLGALPTRVACTRRLFS